MEESSRRPPVRKPTPANPPPPSGQDPSQHPGGPAPNTPPPPPRAGFGQPGVDDNAGRGPSDRGPTGDGFDLLATFGRMSRGWKVLCVASLATVLAAMFPWTRVQFYFVWYDAGSRLRVLVFLAAAAAAALPWLRMHFSQRSTQRNLSVAAIVLAGLCLLLTLVGLVRYLQIASLGILLSLAATGAMVYGAVLIAREEHLGV